MAFQGYGSCTRTVGDSSVSGTASAVEPRVARVGDPNTVRVDRSTEWGNPYRIGRDGTRAEVIAKFEERLINDEGMRSRLPELRGKHLACHCAPLPCHAEVLLKYANNPDLLPPPRPMVNERGVAMEPSVPIPATDARVPMRPSQASPVRVLVTGSRKWADEARLGSALDWAYRNAKTQYPGRRVVLVQGGATGADTMAAKHWAAKGYGDVETHRLSDADWRKEPKTAGMTRNQRMIDSTAHVTLAFNRDNSGGTRHAIARSEASGIPTFIFDDINGVPGHRSTKPQTAPIEVTDATAPTFAMSDPTGGVPLHGTPFSGVNPFLKDALYEVETGVKPNTRKISDYTLTDIEDDLIRVAQASEPDWDRFAARNTGMTAQRPGTPLNPTLPTDAYMLRQLDQQDTLLSQPYTAAEREAASLMWGEAMDEWINSQSLQFDSYHGQGVDPTLWHLSNMGAARGYALQVAHRIDADIRQSRVDGNLTNPWKGALKPPEPKGHMARPGVVGSRWLTDDEMEALRARKGSARKYWNQLDDAEKERQRRYKLSRGIVIDMDTGKMKERVARPDQMSLDEQGNTVYPNRPAKQETDWRDNIDPLDAEQMPDADPVGRSTPTELRKQAEQIFIEEEGRAPVRKGGKYDGDNGEGLGMDEGSDAERMQAIIADLSQEEGNVGGATVSAAGERLKESSGGVTPSRQISQERTPYEPYVDSGELTTASADEIAKRREPAAERAPYQPSLSPQAQKMLQNATEMYRRKYGEAPKITHPAKTGLDMYDGKTRERMTELVATIAKRNTR